MPIALFKRTRGMTALTCEGGGDLAATPLNPPVQSRTGYHRQTMGGSIKQRLKRPLSALRGCWLNVSGDD